MAIPHINRLGRRLLKSLAQLRDANREMQEVGRWMSVATHLGRPGTWVLVDPDLVDVELIGALSGSLKNCRFSAFRSGPMALFSNRVLPSLF